MEKEIAEDVGTSQAAFVIHPQGIAHSPHRSEQLHHGSPRRVGVPKTAPRAKAHPSPPRERPLTWKGPWRAGAALGALVFRGRDEQAALIRAPDVQPGIRPPAGKSSALAPSWASPAPMSSDSTPIPRWQIVVSWILSCLPLAAFLPSAFFKIAQPGDFLANWTLSLIHISEPTRPY